MTKLSYAVTVCDEILEIKRLLHFLFENKTHNDEVVVFVDATKAPSELVEYLERIRKIRDEKFEKDFCYKIEEFGGHFAQWKNKLNTHCKGQYIFQIDADEIPNRNLIKNLPFILEVNQVDVLTVPRINTVEGLTQEHINKWGWNVDNRGRVNFPDRQMRVYKNIPEIKWVNKVHEVLYGFKTIGHLPPEEQYCLYHPKNISRQERQNSYYDTLI